MPNAALDFAAALPRAALVRACGGARRVGGDVLTAARRAFEQDLVALLNRLRRAELDALARAFAVDPGGPVGALRARLWRVGAELEAGGSDQLGTPWQPVPVALGGRLVHLGPVSGLAPPSPWFPRPVPDPPGRGVSVPGDEPDCLEELLDRATGLLGVRLGPPARDKGWFGARVATLLGLRESGWSEPDWRGEVEVKTVPVVRDRGARWRVSEDPAVAMVDVPPERKLGRVLWIARVADAGDSPLLSWYYQERDAAIAALARRHLHTRPKGPAGARTRGWYLRKGFFAGSGFLRTLNGDAGAGGAGAAPEVAPPEVAPP